MVFSHHYRPKAFRTSDKIGETLFRKKLEIAHYSHLEYFIGTVTNHKMKNDFYQDIVDYSFLVWNTIRGLIFLGFLKT